MSYCATTVLGAENSEVLPPESVTVAVTVRPSETLLAVVKVKEPLPEPSVPTVRLPT